tara:strand:+ start:1001 stop:2035 length:1035 start_codon:yes stop_codon:yes gene_type:complete
MKIQKKYSDTNYQIAIALGDPSGIGPEITLKALGSLNLPKNLEPVLVGCRRNLEIVYKSLKSNQIELIADPKNLNIYDMPAQETFTPGNPNSSNGEASFNWLTKATELVLNGKAKALVTAPISKHIWHRAGHIYSGQTERLGELAGVPNPSMLFTAVSPINGSRLITLLATTHIPFKDVPTTLTAEIITSKLNTLLNFCQKFTINPKLAIAGLNPHAGEEGQLGNEEIEWLIPVINKWRDNHPNIILEGPIPPDTCWLSSAQAWEGISNTRAPNGILALYHDQGLIPVKLIAFDHAVNTTLGLPFIRTSPDHGTAFDIAGMGIARPKSMLAAIKTADELSNKAN